MFPASQNIYLHRQIHCNRSDNVVYVVFKNIARIFGLEFMLPVEEFRTVWGVDARYWISGSGSERRKKTKLITLNELSCSIVLDKYWIIKCMFDHLAFDTFYIWTSIETPGAVVSSQTRSWYQPRSSTLFSSISRGSAAASTLC